MTLLSEILQWTEGLPLWQRDAARRLFQRKGGLSSDDFAELYDLLKAEHGLPNVRGMKPEPLRAAHLPAVLKTGENVILKAMRDLKFVNRIAPNQVLPFAPSGMTVIYGGNASGKSGYTRVMKRACRSRDQDEKVHPDANDPAAQNCIPEATFEIEINGKTKPVHWTYDSDSPDELATIAVFDSHCARAYLTAEQDVAYLPYGLDVVENLANIVLPELTRRLEKEIAGIDINSQQFEHLLGETQVGRLIASLNHKSDHKKISALGTLSKQEIKRIAELDQVLAEPDPSIKAKELRLSAGRLKGLMGRIESALALVSDDAIKKHMVADKNAVTASHAEKQAAEALISGEILLPGTGEQVWKALFEAARKFSTEIAYPEHEFPYTSEDAVCLLCQQPLSDAGKRFKRFEEYIRNDVAKTAVLQRQNVKAVKSEIARANLSVGLDETLAEELAQYDEAAVLKASNLQASIEARRTWILEAFDSHEWETAPVLSDSPRQRLRNLAAKQYKSARTFARAADEVKSTALKNELGKLRALQNLSICLEAVLALIERMKKKWALEACKKDLKTKPISDKSKALSSSIITDTLRKALDDEFELLGMGYIKTRLKERAEKGQVKYQLLLDLPVSVNLQEILSEGEQRAIALGSFLAELKLANHSGGIVFDDPVSSLDHLRRGKLAKRLSLESLNRQVLVFTHEVVFLYQLCDECEKLGIPPSHCFLEMAGSYFGNVAEGLPWRHKSYNERIDFLEKAQKRLEQLPWPADPSESLARQIIQQYNLLRATIERVVQDFVLGATVQRFRNYIEISKLKLVVGLEQSEVDEISRLYKRCHDVTDAHDPPSAKNETPPTPDDLKRDIDDLNKLIQKIKDRRREVSSK